MAQKLDAQKLDAGARAKALKELKEWRMVDGREAITRKFAFANFNAAFAFMTAAALLAEKMDHHPEWFNVYSRVEVTLSTHSCRGVSELDVKMAKFMDETAAGLGGKTA